MKVGVAGVAAVSKRTATKSKTKKIVKKTASKLSSSGERRIAKLVLDHRDNGRKLARSILRRWRVRMPVDEIDSIVDLSLCEAARRYCLKHGAAFLTFFFYHLRGHLIRAVTRAAQASNIFMAQGQHNGVDTSEWQYLTNEPTWPCFADHLLLYYRDTLTPENEVLRKESIIRCREAVTKLDSLQQEIVSRSFSEDQPLIDIAKALGYSRCHISRVKKSALLRLQEILAQNGIWDKGPNSAKLKEVVLERSSVLRQGKTRQRSRRRLLPVRQKTKTSRLRIKLA